MVLSRLVGVNSRPRSVHGRRRVCASAIAMMVLAGGANAATHRSGVHQPTVNPPQTSHPIFYPIAIAAATPHDDASPEALLREFMRRHTAMDYPAAAEAAMRLVSAAPDLPESHYNLACVMCRLQRIDEAIDALRQAVECGWRDLNHMAVDPDLNILRKSEAYDGIVETLRQKIQSERLAPAPLRTDGWQVIADELIQQVPEMLHRYRVPGASIALVQDGELKWTGEFGVADRKTARPLTANDRFLVRSPTHLLALMGACDLQSKGGPQLAQVIEQAVELNGHGTVASRGAGRSPAIVRVTETDSGRIMTIGLNRPAAENERSSDRGKPLQFDDGGITFGLLKFAIEVADHQTFGEYCAQRLFEPLMMSQSQIGMAKSADALISGHTRMGTPVAVASVIMDIQADTMMCTTAADLAKLIEAAMAAPTDAPDVRQAAVGAMATVSALPRSARRSLDLAMEIKRTEFGERVEVEDVSAGMGCLMRWYPKNRSGVVVLFNSEAGLPAAARIAHLALGGE